MGVRSLVLALVVLALAGCDVILGLDRRADPLVDATAGDATPGDATPGDCPIGYVAIPLESSRYRVLSTGAFYAVNKELCTADGTHLAAIDSMTELSRIKGLVAETPTGAVTRFFVGVVQEFDAGDPKAGWYLVTGEPLSENLWAADQPNDGGDQIENNIENFANLATDLVGLNDARAEILYGGVCECDGKPAVR